MMDKRPKLALSVIPGDFAICRFAADTQIPSWAHDSVFVSASRTPEELSIVTAQDNVPPGVKCESGWSLLKFEGPIDFGLTGILASILAPLAEGKIGIFAISTFDTDYVMVKKVDLQKTLQSGEWQAALNEDGHVDRCKPARMEFYRYNSKQLRSEE